MVTTQPLAADLLHVVPVPAVGAEDVLVVQDRVYTATEDGSVWEIIGDGDRVRRVGRTEGRPLGLELLADGRLLVCDAYAGLLALDPATGDVEALVTVVEGRRMVFCNNAAVAADGTVYFSDSSAHHPIERWRSELLADSRTGRLARLAPDGSVDVLVEGLRFANGVALAEDESYVCVAETGGRSVVRRWLTGPRAGRTEPFVEDLPGYPDNIALGSDGLVWVTLGSPKVAALETALRLPGAVRRLVGRVPTRLLPDATPSAQVMAFDDAGGLVHDVSFEPRDFHMVTGVREHHARVWLGSLAFPAVAWFDLRAVTAAA